MPTEITSANFEDAVARPGILILDFWAAWCGPCRSFAPIFEAAAGRHPEIVFGKVDTEAQGDLAKLFRIQSIPTTIVFRDSILLFAQPGLMPEKVFEQLITEVQALDMDEVRKKVAELEAKPAAPPSAAAGADRSGPGEA